MFIGHLLSTKGNAVLCERHKGSLHFEPQLYTVCMELRHLREERVGLFGLSCIGTAAWGQPLFSQALSDLVTLNYQ